MDVLCLTEHWMKHEEIDKFVIGSELELATTYCRTAKAHGGVAIFTKYDQSSFKIMHEVNQMSIEIDCEMAAIEITDLKLVIVAVYRSPIGDINKFFETIEKMLSSLNHSKKQTIIIGDFNVNLLVQSRNQECLVNLFRMYGLDQTIFEPTRNKNCLDNVFTSLKKDFTSTVVNNHVSDHLGQLFTLKVYSNEDVILEHNSIVREIINDNSMREFKYYLSKESWKGVFEQCNINDSFNIFMDTFKFYYDLCFVKRFKNNSKKKNKQKFPNFNWYNSDLKALKDRLDFLYNLYKSTGNSFYHNEYKLKKAQYRLKIRQAKIQANARYIEQSDNKTKALWQIVNNKKKSNGFNTNIAPEDFNDFFVSVAGDGKTTEVVSVNNLNTSSIDHTNLITMDDFNEYLSNHFVPDNVVSLSLSLVTEDEVIKTVKELASKKSKDHFGFTNVMMKDTINFFVSPLTILINNCFEQGEFPDILKITKIHPIFKKGSKDHISNYRPVAIVPVFSKVIEVLLGKRLMHFLESYNLLCKEQFGFRKGLSTTHAIISLVDKVLDCYEKKDFAAVTFCDLSKAFDRISHGILIKKLEYYNVKGKALQVFESYLKNRIQYVITEMGVSSCRNVTDGVPQGSVLGPLLFLVAINDLRANVPADIVLYADDTTVVSRNSNYNQLLEEAKSNVDIVENWLKANNLVINKDKTSTVVFSLRDHPNKLDAQNSKFLGVIFDSTLNWHQHIISLKKRLCSSIFALRRLSGEIDRDSLIQAYYGLFQCHLNYGLIVWGSSSHAQEVFFTQKKALRVISGAAQFEHCRQIFIDFKVLTLFSLYIYQCLMYLRNNIDQTSCRGDIHSYNTRSRNNVNLPQVRLEKTDKHPLIIGSKFYNKLPVDLRLLSDNDFKRKLKRFLCLKAFYSKEEFLQGLWTIEDFNKL